MIEVYQVVPSRTGVKKTSKISVVTRFSAVECENYCADLLTTAVGFLVWIVYMCVASNDVKLLVVFFLNHFYFN